MNPWHDVDPGKRAPETIDCIIEVPRGSRNKYELDKKTGLLRLDRVLYSAVFYPANYGFIPQTYCDDHDPLDILVLGQEQVVPMCILTARPIGVMQMVDQNEEDDKIIAIHENDPAVAHFRDISQLPEHTLNELQRFFEDYKILEHKKVRIERFDGRVQAHNIITKSLRLYTDSFNPDGSKRSDAPVLPSEMRGHQTTGGRTPSRTASVEAARRHAAGLDSGAEDNDAPAFVPAPLIDPPETESESEFDVVDDMPESAKIASHDPDEIQFDFQMLDAHAPRVGQPPSVPPAADSSASATPDERADEEN